MVSWANHNNRTQIADRATVINNQTIANTRTFANDETCGIVVLRNSTISSTGRVTVTLPDAGVILDRGFEVQPGGTLTIQ